MGAEQAVPFDCLQAWTDASPIGESNPQALTGRGLHVFSPLSVTGYKAFGRTVRRVSAFFADLWRMATPEAC